MLLCLFFWTRVVFVEATFLDIRWRRRCSGLISKKAFIFQTSSTVVGAIYLAE